MNEAGTALTPDTSENEAITLACDVAFRGGNSVGSERTGSPISLCPVDHGSDTTAPMIHKDLSPCHKLSPCLRERWDRLIGDVGGKLGLSDCRVFLENKIANDIFYEGSFKGMPCIVKCSSRAPESILNEYELGRRLHSVDPVHFPAVYVCHPGPFAFVVSEKVEGGRSLADSPDEKYADEILAILDSLYAANVIHRDILPSNFLIAPDGHLKLIDFQFAVDMDTKRIDPWLKRNPKYHFAVFAAIVTRRGAWWDDAYFAGMLMPSMRERVRSRIGRLRFEIAFSPLVRMRLRFHVLAMIVQRMFCARGSRKRKALDRRLGRFK